MREVMIEQDNKKSDVFDKLDIFDIIYLNKFKKYQAPPRIRAELTDEIRQMIVETITASLKDKIAAIVAEVKPEKIIETKTVHKEMVSPPERVIVKEVDIEAMAKAVESKVKEAMLGYEKNWKNIAPIVVPNGIANMEGHGGQFLTTDGRITKWQTVTAGGGGISPDVYTVSNVVTDRSYDATLTSLDEIANVLGSLIASLQGAGIIQ